MKSGADIGNQALRLLERNPNYARSTRIVNIMDRYMRNIRNFEYDRAPQNIGRGVKYPSSVYMGNSNT